MNTKSATGPRSPGSTPPPPRLTKSRYLSGLQCPRRLWWEVHEPNAPELKPDPSDQFLFDRGHEVGKVARSYCKYFSVRNGSGLEDPGGPEVDVLVCDEAQRLSLKTNRIFQRAPVTVVVYDEGQILNSDDRGTLTLLTQRAKEAGKIPEVFVLPTPHRCRGGEAYVQWVDQFLLNPAAVYTIPEIVRREYTPRTFRPLMDFGQS